MANQNKVLQSNSLPENGFYLSWPQSLRAIHYWALAQKGLRKTDLYCQGPNKN